MGMNPNSNLYQQHQQSQQSSALSSHHMSNHPSATYANSSSSAAQQQQQQQPHPTAFHRAATPQMSNPSLLSSAVVGASSQLAACQVTPGSEYILCKILLHDTIHEIYKLADEDVESNKSKFLFVVHTQRWLVCSDCVFVRRFPSNPIYVTMNLVP